MKPKTIFIDADGTLCDDTGQILASTKKAIKLGQEQGHRFFLCTGRAPAEITENILSLKLDGIIGGGGSYCQVKDEVILNQVFTVDETMRVINFLKKNQIEYYLGSNQGLFASSGLKQKIWEHLLVKTDSNQEKAKEIWTEMNWFLELLIEDETKIDHSKINKICFVNHSIPFAKVFEEFNEDFYIIPSTSSVFGNESGEIGLSSVRKQTAIEHVIQHLGIDSKDTIAFGDGLNDIDMFDAVELGIAMGNACDELLAVADRVTASNNEDGIYLAMKELQLLGIDK